MDKWTDGAKNKTEKTYNNKGSRGRRSLSLKDRISDELFINLIDFYVKLYGHAILELP